MQKIQENKADRYGDVLLVYLCDSRVHPEPAWTATRFGELMVPLIYLRLRVVATPRPPWPAEP